MGFEYTPYCMRIQAQELAPNDDGTYTLPPSVTGAATGVTVDKTFVEQRGVPTSVAGVYDFADSQDAQWKVMPSIAGGTVESFTTQAGPCEPYQVTSALDRTFLSFP